MIASEDEKWIGRAGFFGIEANTFLQKPETIRDTVGVYMIFIANIHEILRRAGLPETEKLLPWSFGDFHHVYTGESVAMRSRAILHPVSYTHLTLPTIYSV